MFKITDFTESNLLYKAKNFFTENGFSEKNMDYDEKYLYELYFNIEKNLVLVSIQNEYFSLPSIEPVIDSINKLIE